MPGTGFYQRAKPYLEVLRGDTPNDPFSLTSSAPVKSGVTLKSGQVCSKELVSGEWQWALGWVAGTVPHLARQDSDSPDVLEAGYLTGLSTQGKFRLRTGYYKTDAALSYIEGRAVAPDGTTGNITTVDGAAGTNVMGYCSNDMNGPKQIGPQVVSGVWTGGENNEALDGLVVDFDTGWSPKPA